MHKKVDFLVIGSGIAGLSFALKVSEYGKVCVVTKNLAEETATKYAQGGIAAVMYSPDTYEKHIKDTLNAGDDLCNEKIVRITITESTERIKELIEWGAQFDKTDSGKYSLGKEGGHSESRVLHHKDSTGQEIIRALLQKVKSHPNIELLENHFTIDLITQHHLGIDISRGTTDIKCYGAYVLCPDSGEVVKVLAKKILLATGGAGNVYSTTTNPEIATGDGIAMAYRAKARIENMEFVQFHPTSLYNPGEVPSFLITEALRGFGAILKTTHGEEFMHKYDDRGSLAPRDIVARAIDSEMKHSGDDYVYLDATFLKANELIQNFPTVYAKCLSIGIDITKEKIPVVPAAHYLTGGIKVDEHGLTSIKNLYATGECASTGLHGANRLASNSLLESAVFSNRAAKHATKTRYESNFCDNIPDWDAEGKVLNEEMVLITQTTKELQSIMSNYVGIVRSDLRLKRAIDRLELIYKETEDLYKRSILSVPICELRNLINVAYLIIKMAQQRKESRGLHYSIDYPDKAEVKMNSRR
ncbi:MAG: L-aspartate oxidase [Bacteroidales bacterium]|nr:L-aspartate oxidase [Bacteroidales bacterium]MCF8403044.1 L-aspartate oxidase [Bacteroidales bacterium]